MLFLRCLVNMLIETVEELKNKRTFGRPTGGELLEGVKKNQIIHIFCQFTDKQREFAKKERQDKGKAIWDQGYIAWCER